MTLDGGVQLPRLRGASGIATDGGWQAGYLYSFPIIGKKLMNRGLGTALAVQALSGRIGKL